MDGGSGPSPRYPTWRSKPRHDRPSDGPQAAVRRNYQSGVRSRTPRAPPATGGRRTLAPQYSTRSISPISPRHRRRRCCRRPCRQYYARRGISKPRSARGPASGRGRRGPPRCRPPTGRTSPRHRSPSDAASGRRGWRCWWLRSSGWPRRSWPWPEFPRINLLLTPRDREWEKRLEIGKKGGRKARETTVMVGVKEPPPVSPSFFVLPRWCSRSEIRGAGDDEEPHHFLSHSRFHTPTFYIDSMGFFNSANLFIATPKRI